MPAPSDPSPHKTGVPIPSANVLALLLAGLSMLGPFSVDTYLPAFPTIETSLHASLIEVQQTLTAYMFAFAMMILWHGALSDAFGRRNIVLMSLAMFSVASLGCASAHSVEYLWAFRILQGISAGAGVVVGRAIIRDLYSGASAAQLLSLVTMIFSIAPALAPIFGGWIVKLLDWRAIFLFLFFYSASLLWVCYRLLPETLPIDKRQAFNPHSLWRNYKQILQSLFFHLKAGVVAFNFAGLFLYVAAAPVFLTRHLKLGPDQFGWQFIPATAGIFLGAMASNRLAGKIPVTLQIRIGFYLLMSATLGNVLYHTFWPPALPWSVLPLFFYTFGMSMVAPAVTLSVLDLFPDIRGTVASCQSFIMTMLGAVVAGVAAPFLSRSALWLASGQLICASIALGLWMTSRYYWQRRRA